MTTITRVIAAPGTAGCFVEDLTALQSRPIDPADRYITPGVTPGFDTIRQPAETVSVGLVLDSGQIAWGDCVSVAYGGKAGRASVFSAREGLITVLEQIAPFLEGKKLSGFRQITTEVDDLTEDVQVERTLSQPEQGQDLTRRELFQSAARLFNDQPPTRQETVTKLIHPGIRYGVSQALLAAVALDRKISRCQVICQEWDLPLPDRPVPLHAQCGRNRFAGVDKMIAHRVDSLPHALVDNLPEQMGDEAVNLIRYTRWIRKRIQDRGADGYHPTIHLDVHGALGLIYNQDLGRILGSLYALEKAAEPYSLRIECPLIMETREEQIEAMTTLREYLDFRRMKVQLVTDEWANTLEDIQAFLNQRAGHMIQIKPPDLGSLHNSVDAVLACKNHQTSAFLGGSCAETDLSARASVHLALATRPALIMAKPGLGIDEGISLITNETNRTLRSLQLNFDQETGS
ncbi:MAG: methylaspartate ammonia-lyase [Anaerolineales bacterium]|nr:methylaspartate ammonia-lyase [Anaerolineales bacterium]